MKKAFTLIELLVVIAIIAILAAILFPVFAQAKLAAKKTQDLSNVKNLGTGTTLYQGDNDDVFPLSQYPGPTFASTGETVMWQRAVHPYVKNGSMQLNAAGESVGKGTGGIFTGPDYPKPNQAMGSYAMHNGVAPEGVFPWSPAGYTIKPVSSTTITLPADKILLVHRGTSATFSATNDYNWPTFLADEWNWVDYMGMSDENGTPTNPNIEHRTVIKNASGQQLKGDCDDMRTGMQPAYDYCGQYPRYRYNGTVNVAFMDGHAKGMRRAERSTTINYARNIFLQGISNGGGSLY